MSSGINGLCEDDSVFGLIVGIPSNPISVITIGVQIFLYCSEPIDIPKSVLTHLKEFDIEQVYLLQQENEQNTRFTYIPNKVLDEGRNW